MLAHLPCPAREAPGPGRPPSSAWTPTLGFPSSAPARLGALGAQPCAAVPIGLSPETCRWSSVRFSSVGRSKARSLGLFLLGLEARARRLRTWLLLVGFLTHVVSAHGALAGEGSSAWWALTHASPGAPASWRLGLNSLWHRPRDAL